MSTAASTFDDLLEINKPPVLECKRLAEMSTNAEGSDPTGLFVKQVQIVEGILVHTYGVASKLTRDLEAPEEIADVWKDLALFCDFVLQALSSLKDRFPNCGTTELYDLALDYKLAAAKRHRGILEEISCQTIEFPKDLLPELN